MTSSPRGAAPLAPMIVILAGVCAALHVGKLPPAVSALQAALGLSLVEAGFLVSLVQLAGMLGGVALGAFADGFGLKRSMVLGLAILGAASAFGGTADSVAWLLTLRAVEGLGFLLVVLPAPGLLRRLVVPTRVNLTLGVWSAYMPFGAAVGLLIGPPWIEALGWRTWWWALAATAAVMAVGLGVFVSAPSAPMAGDAMQRASPRSRWLARLRRTLGTRGPWLVAMSFASYSSQWLAVIGFLPTIYLQAGISGIATGALTALAAAVNIVGNLVAGRLLQRGRRPTSLLGIGFAAMGVGAIAAFAGAQGAGLPPALRYAAILLFSMIGGLIPATLFSLAVRLAPTDETLSSTVGWVQQWSSLGQFAGPPLVALAASRTGGWHWTWLVTGALSLIGLGLSSAIGRTLWRDRQASDERLVERR